MINCEYVSMMLVHFSIYITFNLIQCIFHQRLKAANTPTSPSPKAMPTTGVPTPRPPTNAPQTPSPPMKTPNKNTVASPSPSNAPQYDTMVQSTTQQVVIHPDEQSEQSLLLVETVSFSFSNNTHDFKQLLPLVLLLLLLLVHYVFGKNL